MISTSQKCENYEKREELILAKEYPLLIGMERNGNLSELHNTKEVAEFICEKGLKNDVYVFYPNGMQMLSTFGIYLNRIDDMEYRSELLKELIPMQYKIEEECSENMEFWDVDENEIEEPTEMDLT